jgi:hypothetical protein
MSQKLEIDLIVDLLFQLSDLVKKLNISSEYSIDGFSVATCDNILIIDPRMVQGVVYLGKKVSIRRFLRIQYPSNLHCRWDPCGIYISSRQQA